VKITIVESSVGHGPRQQILASYIVNDSIVIDAGSIGFVSPLDVQKRVKHVFISHSHTDHLASLPIFIDNVYAPSPECPIVYGNADVLDCLQKHIFNERIWPDMIRLSGEETPFLKMEEIHSETPVEVDGVRITPVAIDHIVPTMGFILEDDQATIAIVSDTDPTTRIWDVVNQQKNLKAVLLESSFPNHMEWLAERAMHLTPELFAKELTKLHLPARVIAIHIKAAFDTQIKKELAELNLPHVEIGEPGKTYEFH
jgi:cAMP phosphodiesterase